METIPKDFKEFIELLNANKVRYLVVGGYALAYHGQPRFTGDMDFFLSSDTENAERVLKSLTDFGFGDLDITVHDLTQKDQVIQLGYPPLRIDLLTSIDGVDFESAWEHRIDGLLSDIPCNICVFM